MENACISTQCQTYPILTMVKKLNFLSTRAVLLWCLISLALSRRRMIYSPCYSPNELKFSAALPSKIEIFINGEKASTIFIDSAGKVSKNQFLAN